MKLYCSNFTPLKYLSVKTGSWGLSWYQRVVIYSGEATFSWVEFKIKRYFSPFQPEASGSREALWYGTNSHLFSISLDQYLTFLSWQILYSEGLRIRSALYCRTLEIWMSDFTLCKCNLFNILCCCLSVVFLINIIRLYLIVPVSSVATQSSLYSPGLISSFVPDFMILTFTCWGFPTSAWVMRWSWVMSLLGGLWS